MKRLGIIGGLGPMASVYFWELVEQYTDANGDQEHISVSIISIPETPDRTAYILDHAKKNPLEHLVEAGVKLKNIGAEYIAIPCITSHYFHEKLEERIGLPIINLPMELAVSLQSEKVHAVGILATSGTIKSGFLQNALQKNDIKAVIPNELEQQTIMRIIYEELKAGKEPDVKGVLEVGEQLKNRGADRILLGCTELSLIKRDYGGKLPDYYIDSLEVLAKAAVRDSFL